MKKKIIVLIAEILIAAGLTFLSWPVFKVTIPWLRIVLIALINLSLGLSGFLAAKLTGVEIDFEWKNGKQYLIGLGICLLLSLIVGWIPALLGVSLVGSHEDFNGVEFTYQFLEYLFIIGPVEEMLFRVYFQKTFISLYGGRRWAGVLTASLLFGLWHLINGSLIQVAFTFAIGCAFGFAKEYIKDLHYPGIAMCHGLYDFLNYIVTITII